MAANSKRELILLEVKDLIEQLSTINTVERVRLSFTDLNNYSGPQLPLVAVVGGLPKPIPKKSGRTAGDSDKFISSLNVDLICHAMDNVNPDSTVSSLADDLWAKIYSKPTLVNSDYPKGLVLDVSVNPEIKIGIWDPYVVFKMSCVYKYVRGTGGI